MGIGQIQNLKKIGHLLSCQLDKSTCYFPVYIEMPPLFKVYGMMPNNFKYYFCVWVCCACPYACICLCVIVIMLMIVSDCKWFCVCAFVHMQVSMYVYLQMNEYTCLYVYVCLIVHPVTCSADVTDWLKPLVLFQ